MLKKNHITFLVFLNLLYIMRQEQKIRTLNFQGSSFFYKRLVYDNELCLIHINYTRINGNVAPKQLLSKHI